MGHKPYHHFPLMDKVVGSLTSSDRYRETKKITLLGAVINLFLSLIKILVGYTSQSQALIADGIHSLSDLISDGMVLIAARHSHRKADENHPYGHGRIETVATVALGLLLIVVAGGIAVDAVRRILEPDFLMHPGILALLVAAISIVVKEVLYRYTMRVGAKFKSNMLKANAWHHRSDAISSVIVLAGVGGTMLGFQYLDAIAAIGVAAMIVKIGWDLCVQSVRELVDTALERETVESINDTIMHVDGVRELHSLRTRRMGGEALVDVHVLVNPKLSVSEGHHIGEKVREQVVKQVDEVSDVMVHIDPEDDELMARSHHLPQRQNIINKLKHYWSGIPEADLIDNITLHYLDGKIHVELTLPLDKMESQQHALGVAKQLTEASKEDKNIADTRVLFH
ncbi:MAG: cation diffusion facilitator family transporter [Gammaproteobacteria bacterium]|nr:cation diffusion facilitator family transporter [Gammaproteobacteria bacterium]